MFFEVFDSRAVWHPNWWILTDSHQKTHQTIFLKVGDAFFVWHSRPIFVGRGASFGGTQA